MDGRPEGNAGSDVESFKIYIYIDAEELYEWKHVWILLLKLNGIENALTVPPLFSHRYT